MWPGARWADSLLPPHLDTYDAWRNPAAAYVLTPGDSDLPHSGGDYQTALPFVVTSEGFLSLLLNPLR